MVPSRPEGRGSPNYGTVGDLLEKDGVGLCLLENMEWSIFRSLKLRQVKL